MSYWLENFIAGISFGSVVNAVASLAGLVAAIAAIRGVSTWRSEMVGRRRAELAEETLTRFYEGRDYLAWTRHPFAFAGEGQTRETPADETESERRDRYVYYVPVERITKKAEFWASFDAATYRFRAVFGPSAAEPFNIVRNRRHDNSVAAGALIRHDRGHRHIRDRDGLTFEHNERLIAEWEETIWGAADTDQVASDIDAAVATMEITCRPAIDGFYRAQRRRWWL